MTSKSGSSEADPAKEIALLYSAAAIGARVQGIADEIAERGRLGAEPLVLIGLLSGAVPFATDLSRALVERGVPLAIDYVRASSYSGRSSMGSVALGPPPFSITGRDVLIVDDILDTGLTLETVLAAFGREGPMRLASCVLLDKRARRLNGLMADFVGFSCPDLFVVGYGMDLDGRFRELPFIGTIASP